MDGWEELDALADELAAANEEWGKTVASLRDQIKSFSGVTDAVQQHYVNLEVEAALLAMAQRLLGDTGRLHTARLNFGLTRSAALVWYPIDDPREALSLASPEGQYSIEVRIGPRYLLGVDHDRGSGDQRISILIAGQKQLVATLPTAPEKFRAALLGSFKAPGYSGPPREAPQDKTPAAETVDSASGPAEPGADGAEAANTDAAGSEMETNASIADSGHTATAPSDVELPGSEPAVDQPAGDTVIELPGSSR